jgi:hypothetical protein
MQSHNVKQEPAPAPGPLGIQRGWITGGAESPPCASKSRLASGSGCGWWVGENTTSELEISASSGSSPQRCRQIKTTQLEGSSWIELKYEIFALIKLG